MEKTVLQWNMENWLTVVLMVAIGYAFLGLGIAFVRGNLPAGSEE